MKIYLIESRDTPGEPANPKCFFKATDAEMAKRIFLAPFHRIPHEVTVTELTWELFNQIAPDEFMLVDNVDF